jgi:predicted ATP-grasp superfamily ATP-dependent carboligase
VGIPDPEGAAMLLETISEMPSVLLEIDTGRLRKQGQDIKRQLKGFMYSVRKEQEGE